MYNQYGQQGNYGQQPMQQQRTGFQPQSSFGQQQGFGQTQSQQSYQSAGTAQNYGMNQGNQFSGNPGLVPQQTGFQSAQGQFQQGFGQHQYGQYQQVPNMPAQQTGYTPQSQNFNQNTFIAQEPQARTGYMQPQMTGFMQSSGIPQQNATGYQGFSGTNPGDQLFQPMPQQQQQQAFVPSQTGNPGPAAPALKRQKTGANIPSTRLSFVQAADQQKFESLFAKAVGPYNTALPGDEAKTILMKSGLPANQLSKIWSLSDTSRSGQLLFPEFVLAMHLCNDALRKGRVPERLDEKLKNEVTGMVDQISWAAADTSAAPSLQTSTSAPNFATAQPQNQMSNVSIMAQQMQPAQLGFYNPANGMQPQATGFQQLQPQRTGYPYIQPGLTGVQQAGITGAGSLQNQQTGYIQFPMQSLVSQPTGKPGQWGFVHAPQGSVQGMQALGAAMMPGAAPSQGGFSMMQQQGAVEVPWAITKEEKAIYDTIFQAWDKKRQGFVEGPVAIEVFGSSGVQRQDLELIWALADSDDKGKLNSDEFAVALHLVYRKLNGYEVPPVLPPELIPPSTRNFGDSISQVKNMLQQDASSRTGPTSYMKNRSFKDDNANRDYSKDGTVYKHNDSDVGYVSAARRRAAASSNDSARASPAPEPSQTSSTRQGASLSDLKKLIKEKQVILDALDQRDEADHGNDAALNAQARRESDELVRQIRKVQAKLDSHQNAHLLSGDDNKERDNLQRRLQNLVDKLPEVASQVRTTERRIQEVEYEIWSIKDKKDHPGSASITGTGPGGQVTDADRRRAKTKAMMAARTAALTGKPAPKLEDDDLEAAARRQAEKVAELNKSRENNEQMIKDIEESAETLRLDIESALATSIAVVASEHERRRWNDAVGVESEVRDLIHELNKGRSSSTSSFTAAQNLSQATTVKTPARPAKAETLDRAATPQYSSFSSGEDRAAYLKQAAEARMAERLAALGIRPTKKSSREVPLTNAQVIGQAEPKLKEEVIRAEQEQQAKQRAAIEEEARQAEHALVEAQKQRDLKLQQVAQQERAGLVEKNEVKKQQTDAMKPVDSRQAKLAQLRAEREARLAEEERLERELAADVTSESEAEQPPQIKESNPFNRAKLNGSISNGPTVFDTNTASTTQSSQTTTEVESTRTAESNNPYRKASSPAASSAGPTIPRPPSAAPLVAQRTNAPRAVPARKNSDDWSVASKEDESSSDEEGPSPAALAARLFSGGIIPQRTGGVQTPVVAQRTGASSAANTIGISSPVQPTRPEVSVPSTPAIPPPPPPPTSMPSVPNTHAPPIPDSHAPPVPNTIPPPPGNLPPPPPPIGGLPPPPPGGPPAPPGPSSSAAPAAPAPQDRGALLASIKAGTGLKKVKTVEKGGVSGGRVL